MPTLLDTLRKNQTRSALQGAYRPAMNPRLADPLNSLGSQIGRIDETAGMEPLPAVGTYAAGAGLDRMNGERGGMGYSPQYGYQATGHNAFSNGAMAAPDAGEAWALRNPMGSAPRVGVRDPNARTGSNGDALKIALNRARGGMSLNNDEQLLLNGQPGLQNALAGSFADRRAQAKATVRQRGLARGDARAAARNFRAMTSPRNVRMANGATVSRPGMPQNLAGAMTLGGNGADPLSAALAGLMPMNAAAAFNQTASRERTDNADLRLKDKLGGMAPAIAMLQSDDPAIQAQGAAMLQGASGQAVPATPKGPLTPPGEGMGPNQSMLPDWMDSLLSQGADSIYGSLVTPPTPVGAQRHPGLVPKPAKGGLRRFLETGMW